MMKNFAGQPEGGGNITILTAQDLIFDVNPTPPIFQKRPIFVDNCKNCNNMENFANFADERYKNFDFLDTSFVKNLPKTPPTPTTSTKKDGGSFLSGFGLDDVFGLGNTVLQSQLEKKKREAALAQGQLALQIEEQRLQQERSRAEAELAKAQGEALKAGSGASKIKAYVLPIAITGVLVIGGIAAYFYFKKKKV